MHKKNLNIYLFIFVFIYIYTHFDVATVNLDFLGSQDFPKVDSLELFCTERTSSFLAFAQRLQPDPCTKAPDSCVPWCL